MRIKSKLPGTLKPLLAALLALAPLAAQAAPGSNDAPGAGTILQQVKPASPQVPSSTGTGLKIERQGGAQMPASAPFEVKTIQLSGNTLFEAKTLHALVMDAEGKSLTLTQIDELAAKITEYYRSHGYTLSRALVPAQTIDNGVVRIEIIEARYGKIKLDNKSQVGDALMNATISALQSGQAIEQGAMDRSLLLLTDMPGVGINATLKPGDTVGTADLLVEASSGPAASGSVLLDNYGNRYTGKTRAGLAANYNNPLHHGDSASFNATTSGHGMSYGRVAYESLLSGHGTKMGAAYSALHYTLGDTLSSLNAHGTATVASLWAKHPILRGQRVNLYGQLQFEQKKLRDHIDASGMQTDRHLNNWTANLTGDCRDTVITSGVNTWSLGWTAGRVAFDDTAAQLADAAAAKTGGKFTKWNVSLARLQSLSPQNSLYLALSAQGSNTNLDSAEKMIAGGPNTVRAYDMGAISGDAGALFSAELRHDLAQPWYGQWQAVAFVDNEHVQIDKTLWAPALNGATLSGAGVGLNWAGQNQWSAKAYAAKRIGTVPTLVGSAPSARAWVEVGKGF